MCKNVYVYVCVCDRQQRLLGELDMLKKKVVHMRDAEARAKV